MDAYEVPNQWMKSSLATVCGTRTPVWGQGHPTPPAHGSNGAKPAPQELGLESQGAWFSYRDPPYRDTLNPGAPTRAAAAVFRVWPPMHSPSHGHPGVSWNPAGSPRTGLGGLKRTPSPRPTLASAAAQPRRSEPPHRVHPAFRGQISRSRPAAISHHSRCTGGPGHPRRYIRVTSGRPAPPGHTPPGPERAAAAQVSAVGRARTACAGPGRAGLGRGHRGRDRGGGTGLPPR